MRKARVYDYVIVGAGSAGCVLASRLTEDAATTVLLLEAGGADRHPTIHMPAAFSRLFKSAYDWAYETEVQAHLNGRRLYWPRGKVVGGSSSINAMIYTRGSCYDYDHWATLGNEGWDFAHVLPYFKRAQHQERGASDHHGVGGPLNVADLRSTNPLSHVFIEAGIENGLHHNCDFNGLEQEGVGFFQVTQKRGRRHSAAVAYLEPVRRRHNLTVRTRAYVTRVLVEKTRAVGVQYVEQRQAQCVRVNREVILAAGAINSPQLLLLSGIGAADHLQHVGIAVVHDLPGVGRNLQDHLGVPVVHTCTQAVTMSGAKTISNLARYLLFRQGPLTSNIAEAGGFVKTEPGLPAADLQIFFAPAYYLNHGFTQPQGHGFSILSALLRPQSRGRVTLTSGDPWTPPVIQPGYLAAEADLHTLVTGVKLCRRLAGAKALAPFRGEEQGPGPLAQSDGAIIEWIRTVAESCYHPVGTCKMGIDPLAVVDPRLRVHGLEGLRVVDASIMPTIISGTTNAPAMMIAEKAADLIKAGP